MQLLNDGLPERYLPLTVLLATLAWFSIIGLVIAVRKHGPHRKDREPKRPVWFSLLIAAAVYPIALVLGFVVWCVIGLSLMFLGAPPEVKTWGPWGLTGTGIANGFALFVIIPCSCYVSIRTYRGLRWHKSGEVKQSRTAPDAERSSISSG